MLFYLNQTNQLSAFNSLHTCRSEISRVLSEDNVMKHFLFDDRRPPLGMIVVLALKSATDVFGMIMRRWSRQKR